MIFCHFVFYCLFAVYVSWQSCSSLCTNINVLKLNMFRVHKPNARLSVSRERITGYKQIHGELHLFFLTTEQIGI